MENISAEKLREMIYTEYGDSVLDLSGKGLSKVPEAVTDLTELEELDLSDNYLKELPTRMNKLKNLKWLILDKNQLSELPHSICELSNLTWLSVRNNQLCVVPSDIKHLKKLWVLDLQYNQLTTLPDQIGKLKELIGLYVAGNPLTLEGMRKVVKLQNKMKFDTDVTASTTSTSTVEETCLILTEPGTSSATEPLQCALPQALFDGDGDGDDSSMVQLQNPVLTVPASQKAPGNKKRKREANEEKISELHLTVLTKESQKLDLEIENLLLERQKLELEIKKLKD